MEAGVPPPRCWELCPSFASPYGGQQHCGMMKGRRRWRRGTEGQPEAASTMSWSPPQLLPSSSSTAGGGSREGGRRQTEAARWREAEESRGGPRLYGGVRPRRVGEEEGTARRGLEPAAVAVFGREAPRREAAGGAAVKPRC
ncbi:hypothetical protein PVAP13_6KG167806 [Panicum virgatum]|uniref:Uncharacterized protein n=1 Tax=Panicum virgatum TaxID=38727 RepID=A0A8T0RD87_PANVG|nr:hypothetical protein PVAP13_6KG167806 [Panicum virgatum]